MSARYVFEEHICGVLPETKRSFPKNLAEL